MAHHGSSWTERTASPQRDASATGDIDRQLHHHQPFKQAHTSLGVAGHIVHMTGVFVPLIAGELVHDAAKYKKTVRIASIATAAAYEILYMVREQQRRKEQDAKLAQCQGRE